jgi:tetratricopeptide (TPR) repeat protein
MRARVPVAHQAWLALAAVVIGAGCGSAGSAGRIPARRDYPVATHATAAPAVADRVAKALGELSAGRLDAAEHEARAALREAPEHPGAMVALARILERHGDGFGALGLMRHAWREADAGAAGRRSGIDAADARAERDALAPELGRALRTLFERALADKALAEAEALYHEWLQLKTEGPGPETAARLADALLLAGATESACRILAAAADEAGTFARAWCRIAGNAEAIRTGPIDTFGPAADGRGSGWVRVGRALLAHGRAMQAHEAFDRAARLDTDDPRVQAAGAVAALVGDDHASFIERVGRAVRLAEEGEDKRRILTEALALATELNRVDTAFALGAAALDGDLAGHLSPADVVAILSRPSFSAPAQAQRVAMLRGHVRGAATSDVAQVLEHLQRVPDLKGWHDGLAKSGRADDAQIVRAATVRTLVALGESAEARHLAGDIAPPTTPAEALATAAALKLVGVNEDLATWPESVRRWVQMAPGESRVRLAEEAASVAERLAMARALERTDERPFSASVGRSAFALVDGSSKDRGRRELFEIHLFLLGNLTRDVSQASDDAIAHHAAALLALVDEGAWQAGTVAAAVRIEHLAGMGRIFRGPLALRSHPALDIPGRPDASSLCLQALVVAGIAPDTHLRRLAERGFGGDAHLATMFPAVAERAGVHAWLPHRAGLGEPPIDMFAQLDRIARSGGDVCPITRFLHPEAAGGLDRAFTLAGLAPCHPGRNQVLVAALSDIARRPGTRPAPKLQEAASYALNLGFHDAAAAMVEKHANATDGFRQIAMRAHLRAGRVDAALALVPKGDAAPARRRQPGVPEAMRLLAEEGALSAALTLGQEARKGAGPVDSAVMSESFEQLRRMENPDGARALVAELTAPERTVDAGFVELMSRHLSQVGLSDVASELVARIRTQRTRDAQLLRVAYRLALQLRDAAQAAELGAMLIDEIRGNPSQLQSFLTDARLAGIPGLATNLAERMARRFPTAPEAALVRVDAMLGAGDVEGAVRAAGLALATDGGARTTLGAMETLFAEARRPAAFARALAPIIAEGRPRADVSLALARALLANGATDDAAGVLGGLVLDVDAALPLVADLWRGAGFHDAALGDAVRALQVGPEAEAFAFFTRSVESMVATGRSDMFPELLQTLAVVQPDLGHDQRAELADLAAQAGRPEEAEALRRSTATPEARVRAMAALARQCIARNDPPCVLEAWRNYVEARLAGPQLAGRMDSGLVVALFEALTLLGEAPRNIATLAPALVAAFDHRFTQPGPRAALRALAAVIAGASPTEILNRNMFPVRDGLNRIPSEQVAVYHSLVERALAAAEYDAAMAIGRWLLVQTADRHVHLTILKAAIRAGHPDVALTIADELMALGPVANAGVVVEQSALEGMLGLSQHLAETHLQAGGPSPIAQRAIGTLAAVAADTPAHLTPGDTRENRIEQRLFDIAVAFDEGELARVAKRFEPLVGHANIEARIVELATRAHTAVSNEADFGRFVDRMAVVPNLFATATTSLMQTTQRAMAPRHTQEILERLHAASPGTVRWIELGLASAVASGDAALIASWASPERAGRLEPGARAEMAMTLARADQLPAARTLAADLAPTTWSGWRAAIQIAARAGDGKAMESLVRDAGRFETIAGSAAAAELLRAIEHSPEPSVLQLAAGVLDTLEARGKVGGEALVDDALRLSARLGDAARARRWLARRMAAWPGEPLPPDVTTWFVCRAASASNDAWSELVATAWRLVANLPVGARMEQLEAFGTGRLIASNDSCHVVPLPARATAAHPRLAALAERALEVFDAGVDAWNSIDLATRLHLQHFHGQQADAVATATHLAAMPGPHGHGTITLAETLVATDVEAAARLARNARTRPTPGRITDHVGLPDFPVQRARALTVLATTSADPDEAKDFLANARVAWPETSPFRRAAFAAKLATEADRRGDSARAAGARFMCHQTRADAPVCRFAEPRFGAAMR